MKVFPLCRKASGLQNLHPGRLRLTGVFPFGGWIPACLETTFSSKRDGLHDGCALVNPQSTLLQCPRASALGQSSKGPEGCGSEGPKEPVSPFPPKLGKKHSAHNTF